jgi:hypothetical protein
MERVGWFDMKEIPDALPPGPFTRTEAERAGVTPRMLRGRRFKRVFPRVWRLAAHVMTADDWVKAARLALPSDARLTGITLIQRLGLDVGPRFPLHFVIEGDLHIDLDDIFLHRTKKLAPHDGLCVTAAAAFLFYCSHARVIDAIQVGDWLLYWGHMRIGEVRALALSAVWRDGAHEALWILDHLDPHSRSLKESETRAVLEFAGLPRPRVNAVLSLPPGEPTVIGDLLFDDWGLVVEYEGEHHQVERLRYSSDIDRYAVLRRNAIPYLQVTRERLANPRKLALSVYRELVTLGFDGSPPVFGDRWASLFRPVREVVGSRDEWLKAYARGAVS